MVDRQWKERVLEEGQVAGQVRHLIEIRESAQVERRQIVEFQIAIRAPDDAAAAIIFGADAGSDPLVGNAAVEFDEMAVAAAAIARRRAVQQVEFGDAGADQIGRASGWESGCQYVSR